MQKLTPWSFLILQNLWGTAGFYGQISKSGFLPVIHFESRGTVWFFLPAGPNSGRTEPKVDKKRGKWLFFVYRLIQNWDARTWKYTKNGRNDSFLSTAASKNGVRGPESRQKPVEMSDFCLPSIPNSTRAASKVDKKRDKCLIFVYRTLQIRPARPRK